MITVNPLDMFYCLIVFCLFLNPGLINLQLYYKQLLYKVLCVPTVQVGEGGLQQLGEAGSPRLSRGSLLALEVRGLLVL